MNISRRSFLKLMSVLPAAVAVSKMSFATDLVPQPSAQHFAPSVAPLAYGGRGNLIIDFGEHKLYCDSVTLKNINTIERQVQLGRTPYVEYWSSPTLDLTVECTNTDTLKWVRDKMETYISPVVGGRHYALPAEVFIVENGVTNHVASLKNAFFTNYEISLGESGGDIGAVYSLNASLGFDYVELYPGTDELKL